MAPEIHEDNHHPTTSADWWSLGVLLFKLLTGKPPFNDPEHDERQRKDLHQPLTFPTHPSIPPAAHDILTRLLDRDPQRRLGANSVDEIKSHPFFEGLDWSRLQRRDYEPHFLPPFPDDRADDNCILGEPPDFPGSSKVPEWTYTRPRPPSPR